MRSIALLALLVACGAEPKDSDPPAADTDTDTDADTDTDTDADSDTDTDADSDTDTDADSDTDTDADTDADTDTDTDTDPPPACGALPTFEDGLAPTAVVHVAPGGSDTTGDGSAGSPYATLERASQDAVPGTKLELAPGSHAVDQYLADLAGTAGAPIWIGGAAGGAPAVFSGGTQGLHLVRPRYVVVHDLVVEGATGNGINTDDGGDYGTATAAQHVVFRNLEIRDIGTGGNQDCLKLSGLRDYHVLDSLFTRCGAGGSAVDHVGCHHGLIARNRFEDSGSSSIQAKGGSTDIEIRWNRFVDGGARPLNMGGSTGFTFFRPPLDPSGPNVEARDIRAIANIIEGGQTAMAFVGCVDCAAVHNTIVNPDNWLVRILQETTSSGGFAFEEAQGGVFANNLVVFRRADVSTDVNIGPDTQPGTFTWTTNLFYASDAPGSSAPTLPGTEVGSITGVDPLLRADGSIPPGSPADGAGTPGLDARGDFSGACWADPPSIGAFEG